MPVTRRSSLTLTRAKVFAGIALYKETLSALTMRLSGIPIVRKPAGQLDLATVKMDRESAVHSTVDAELLPTLP